MLFNKAAYVEIIKPRILLFKKTYKPHCQRLEAKASTFISLYFNTTIILCSLTHILRNVEFIILYSTDLRKVLFCHRNVFSLGI